MQLSTADKAAVDRVCAAAKRCVIVVVSGRPLILDSAQRDAADAIVAAWLPGSEGAGVADTVFGARPFTGRLPMTWPKTLDQEPINIGDRHSDPLYPFGYGLTTGPGHGHGHRHGWS
jgi:beta-glucosidase